MVKTECKRRQVKNKKKKRRRRKCQQSKQLKLQLLILLLLLHLLQQLSAEAEAEPDALAFQLHHWFPLQILEDYYLLPLSLSLNYLFLSLKKGIFGGYFSDYVNCVLLGKVAVCLSLQCFFFFFPTINVPIFLDVLELPLKLQAGFWIPRWDVDCNPNLDEISWWENSFS